MGESDSSDVDVSATMPSGARVAGPGTSAKGWRGWGGAGAKERSEASMAAAQAAAVVGETETKALLSAHCPVSFVLSLLNTQRPPLLSARRTRNSFAL